MKKILDPCTKFLSWLMSGCLLATIVVITLQIIWRYCFKNPLSWTEQTSRYLFVWLVMLAIPVATYKGSMMAFDMLLKKMKRKLRVVVQCGIYVLCEIFTCYYLYQAIQLCIMGGWRYPAGVHIPMICLYIAQPLCAIFLILIFLYEIIETVKAPKEMEVE